MIQNKIDFSKISYPSPRNKIQQVLGQSNNGNHFANQNIEYTIVSKHANHGQ